MPRFYSFPAPPWTGQPQKSRAPQSPGTAATPPVGSTRAGSFPLRALLLGGLLWALVGGALPGPLRAQEFRGETIDDQVQIGYGLALEDVDGDGDRDILLADKTQFVWYENPKWTRHVLAEKLTVADNVCLAARDLDGDGKAEIAVGAGWNPGDTVNSGAVFYLQAPADRRQRWTAIQLPHEPVVHRMRWVAWGDGSHRLVVAPLHGRGNRGGEGQGVKLLAYERPSDPTKPWKTEVLDDQLHVTHNFDLGQWNPHTDAEEILYLGREGAKLISANKAGRWQGTELPRVAGGGEIRMGLLSPQQAFLAIIEPFHGETLVVYPAAFARDDASTNFTALADRVVVDANLKAGHAIAVANLGGDARQEIVAGWRSPNADGEVGIKLYHATDRSGRNWKGRWIDRNQMATEDLRLADLNRDGKIDIVAAGRATNNLKVYWNLGE